MGNLLYVEVQRICGNILELHFYHTVLFGCGNKHSCILHRVFENVVDKVAQYTRHLSPVRRNEQLFGSIYAERQPRALNFTIVLTESLIDEKHHVELFQDHIIVTALYFGNIEQVLCQPLESVALFCNYRNVVLCFFGKLLDLG